MDDHALLRMRSPNAVTGTIEGKVGCLVAGKAQRMTRIMRGIVNRRGLRHAHNIDEEHTGEKNRKSHFPGRGPGLTHCNCRRRHSHLLNRPSGGMGCTCLWQVSWLASLGILHLPGVIQW